MSDILGKRPKDFFGPEDWDGIDDYEFIDSWIKEQQRLWDEQYAALSRWKKFLYNLGLYR